MQANSNYRRSAAVNTNNAIINNLPKLRHALAHGDFYYCYELQRRYGVRFIEAKLLCRSDIVNSEYLHLKGAKRSNDRYLFAPDIVAWLSAKTSVPQDNPVFTFSYWDYYRWLSSILPNIKQPGRKNRRVTNLPRSNFFSALAKHNKSIDVSVAAAGGHKSPKSTRYYVDVPGITNNPQKRG